MGPEDIFRVPVGGSHVTLACHPANLDDLCLPCRFCFIACCCLACHALCLFFIALPVYLDLLS